MGVLFSRERRRDRGRKEHRHRSAQRDTDEHRKGNEKLHFFFSLFGARGGKKGQLFFFSPPLPHLIKMTSTPPPSVDPNEAFQAVSAYIHSEMESTYAEYALLEAMNKAAAAKYQTLADQSHNLVEVVQGLHAKHEALMPLINEISVVEEKAAQLEAAVTKLEEYARSLEERAKRI